ncbi:MAG TPA: flagellar motor protein [Pseudomonadales bacterium]
MDRVALIGALIGFAAILGGNHLDGGHAGALLNAPALVIVLGGTLGAVMLQTPYARLRRALTLMRWVLTPPKADFAQAIERVCEWSRRTRREGLLGLENILDGERDPFTRKGLELIIDGGEPHAIRRALELELTARTESDLAAAQVYRAMGGYAPTIGILGAVLGLIHVMGNLADPGALGAGIATAFVATIYGVGFANLLFLPVADRLKAVALRVADGRALLVEGLLAIAEGEHPRLIEVRLGSYLERV